LECVVYLG